MNLYNEFSIFTILCQNGYEAGKKIYSKVTRSLSTIDIYNCQQGKSNGSGPYHVIYQWRPMSLDTTGTNKQIVVHKHNHWYCIGCW